MNATTSAAKPTAILGLSSPRTPSPLATLAEAPHAWLAWVAVAGAILIAGYGLFHDRLPRGFGSAWDRLIRPASRGLDRVHSGLVSDYVTWIAVGFAALVVAFIAT